MISTARDTRPAAETSDVLMAQLSRRLNPTPAVVGFVRFHSAHAHTISRVTASGARKENTMQARQEISRRRMLEIIGAASGLALTGGVNGGWAQQGVPGLPPYGNSTIPTGIRSRTVANVNGLTVHMLEAGYETSGRPAILLLHGFPELAYSWRKVMLPLASAGYHVIAPDQRGYGRTTGWDNSYDADPDPFRLLNMVRDATGLVYALGYRSVAMVVGHDAGAPVASWAALVRPDIFRSVTIMSSPFEGPPSVPFDTANGAPVPRPAPTDDELDAELAKLNTTEEVLPELSADTRGQRQHAPRAAGSPQLLPRVLPLQECRLEREHAASVESADRRGDGSDPHLLRDGA